MAQTIKWKSGHFALKPCGSNKDLLDFYHSDKKKNRSFKHTTKFLRVDPVKRLRNKNPFLRVTRMGVQKGGGAAELQADVGILSTCRDTRAVPQFPPRQNGKGK